MNVRVISDDDICAVCVYCTYRPGELSVCAKGWPFDEKTEDYVENCDSYTPED